MKKDIANGFITLYGGPTGQDMRYCGVRQRRSTDGEEFQFDKHKDSTSALRGGKGFLPLVNKCRSRGLLIVGRALSGKTTILRDLCR